MDGGWKACSGCAGDYEDPERSARGPDEEEEDEEGGRAVKGRKEFPVLGELETERRERCAETGLPLTQLEVIRGVLLLAAQCGAWMTLGELAKKTEFPEASISAQLRHRAWRVEKRRRAWEESLKAGTRERVWEYRVRA